MDISQEPFSAKIYRKNAGLKFRDPRLKFQFLRRVAIWHGHVSLPEGKSQFGPKIPGEMPMGCLCFLVTIPCLWPCFFAESFDGGMLKSLLLVLLIDYALVITHSIGKSLWMEVFWVEHHRFLWSIFQHAMFDYRKVNLHGWRLNADAWGFNPTFLYIFADDFSQCSLIAIYPNLWETHQGF